MIVVATIGMLAAVAFPNFVKARTTSQKNACIDNFASLMAQCNSGRWKTRRPPPSGGAGRRQPCLRTRLFVRLAARPSETATRLRRPRRRPPALPPAVGLPTSTYCPNRVRVTVSPALTAVSFGCAGLAQESGAWDMTAGAATGASQFFCTRSGSRVASTGQSRRHPPRVRRWGHSAKARPSLVQASYKPLTSQGIACYYGGLG